MKRSNFIYMALGILLLSSFSAKAQLLPLIGFEGGTIPDGWVYDSSDEGWFYQKGGDKPTGSIYRYPSSSHTGNFNAMYNTYGLEATSSIIVTPTINLQGSVKPVLVFWHAQMLRSLNSKLKVYYRINSYSAWVQMGEYLNPTTGWVLREIIIPDAAKVSTCQIGFEGISQLGCWGMCLDDIKVEERGFITRQVSSLTLVQNNTVVPSGSSTNPIGYINIIVTGNTGNLPLNSFSIEFTGTNINDLNTNQFEVYVTNDSIFSSKNKLTTTISTLGNKTTFSGINQNLWTGENYIWVCASVKETAPHNDIIDFKILENSFNINGNLFPGSVQEPVGESIVEESIFYDGFESAKPWSYTSGTTWQRGIPLTGGYGDPNYAFSGNNILATNLSGNYPNGISPYTPDTITSPLIDAKFYKNVKLHFRRWLIFHYFDKTSIQCSVDGGQSWIKIWQNTGLFEEQNWKSISFNLNNIATRKQKVKIRFSIDSTDYTGNYGGWNIDNFAVTGDFIAKDIGISGITAPVAHCGMTNAETVTVKIKNFGGTVINGPYDVGFSLDNGATYVKETVNLTIPIDGEISYTFNPATANLLSPGLKQLKFKTFLLDDEDLTNDTYSTSLYVYPTESYNYSTSFETSNKYWNPSGTNSTWAWGIIAKPIINKASDGTKGWATSLKSNHANSELSYLESPCFDFSTAEYPVFSFDYWVNTEANTDGFMIEFSIDGGTTWSPLLAHSGYSSNWCTGSNVSSLGSDGWSGTSSTGYQTAKTLLPSSVNNKNNIKFRFKFASDYSNSNEGVAIDNIKIYELPYDAGVLSLNSPTTQCFIGNVKLNLNIKNFGYRPLKSGLKVPVEIKVDSYPLVKDTLVLGANISQGNTTSFETKNTYDITQTGMHTIRANTNITSELSRSNDTLKISNLEVRGIPNYSLGPDIGKTAPINFTLNAGSGLGWTYLWNTSQTSQTINVTSAGEYWVEVTKNGCTSKDTVMVLLSDGDFGVTAVTGLDDACEYPSPVKPSVTIKNFGPGTLLSTKSIPVAIMINGKETYVENFTPASDLLPNQTASYTFTNALDLSKPDEYRIKLYTKAYADLTRENDTLQPFDTTHVWGLPKLQLPQDTIVSTNATSITLDAGSGFDTYSWKNSSVTDRFFTVPSLHSAWYVVTVTDKHNCGNDKDSVYINAKDIGIIDIENPYGSFCGNVPQKVVVRIKNLGQDDYPTGTIVKLNYITPNESITDNFTLQTPLAVNNSIPLQFSNFANLSFGEGFVRAIVEVAEDPNHSNDVYEKSVFKQTSPTVSFNPSTLHKTFGAETYYVSPIYSADVKSYLWQDYSTDSLFAINGNPPSKILKVIAFDLNDQLGCSDTASLAIVAEDMAIDSITSPTNQCVLGNGIPIKIKIANKGNFDYPAGTSYTIGITVDGISYPNEVRTLSTNLAPGEKIALTLNPILNLSGKTNSNIQISVSTAMDANTSNNILNKAFYATGFPTISLGSDRTVHSYNDTLKAGENFSRYLWKFNADDVSTLSTYVATQTGNYSVTVTDFNGCQATDDVVLTFVVDDISVFSLENPKTGCDLKVAEDVKVMLKNTGSEIIPIGKSFDIGFKHEGITQIEHFTITGSNLLAGQSRSFDLNNKMGFNSYKTFNEKVWVTMPGDLNPSNDTLITNIVNYPPVSFSFDSDTIEVKGSDTTLVAISGFTSYLWSTGATTESISVNSPGDYWVELANINGCKDRDTVYVKFLNDLALDSLIAPQPISCSLTSSETITIRLKNTGNSVIKSGTKVSLSLKLESALVANENYTLTNDLPNGNTIDYSFTQKLNLSAVGNHNLKIRASISNDNEPANDSISKYIYVYGFVNPTLGSNRTISSPTVLNPGEGYSSYLWSTGETTQTITVNATGTYSVTVTDANGCQGTASVQLTWQENVDVQATAIISPTTNCYKPDGQKVTVTLKNLGSSTLVTGQSFDVSYQIDTNTPVVQTLILNSNFATNQTKDFEFNQKANLNPGTYTLYLKTIINTVSGTVTSYPVIINANPIFAFSNDTVKVELPYQLPSGISGVTYLWNTGSTNASIQVSTPGKYWLTVTNSSTQCSTTDTIVVVRLTSAEVIPGSNAKVTFFPNPVKNELAVKIETDKNESFTIDLINPSGQTVKNIKTDLTQYFSDKIDVKGFSPGLYLLKVGNGKGNAVFKVIVQH